MVLQDLGDAPADDFGSGQNPSDGSDSYSSTSSQLDTSSFAKPLPLPFMGFSENAVRRRTEATIKFAERKIHRAMTHEEQQVLAAHLFKMEETKSYFAALGVGAGGLRAYKTMGTYRYPFYQPKVEDIKPDKFLFVKGSAAQYARHTWRFACYLFVAGQVGKLIGQAVAQPIAAQATANEPQLAQFGRDLKAGLEGDQRKMREYTNQTEQERKEVRERFQKERQERNNQVREALGLPRASSSQPPTQTSGPAGTAQGSSGDDDMSPTSGADTWLSSSSSSSWSDLGLSPDTQNENTPPAQETARSRRDRYRAEPRRDDDDMSPTGGLFQDDVQQQSRPGESAWERLRRGGAPPPNQRISTGASHREQREGSTLGDSFTFAESDADRKKAQEKAQREFDARLERERQGKDFNEERRW